MRLFAILTIGLAGLLTPIPKATADVHFFPHHFAPPSFDRMARVQFNSGLPPMCDTGWNGRGIGVVATCSLGWRSQVRFIDGFTLPCMTIDCRDRAMRVNRFLGFHGF